MRKMKFKEPESWMMEGAPVYYHPIIKDKHDGVPRNIESKPWKLGHGQWVVKVTDVSGGVAIEAISKRFVEE